MLSFLPEPLLGLIACTLMVLNILLWVPILLLVSMVKRISINHMRPSIAPWKTPQPT